MTFSMDFPRRPIPMSHERRDMLRLMAEREADGRAEPARTAGRPPLPGSKAGKVLALLKATGDWFSVKQLTAAASAKNGGWLQRCIENELLAGRLERKRDPSCRHVCYLYRWRRP